MSDELKKSKARASLYEVLAKLEEAGIDPISELATIAKDPNTDLDTRVKILRDLNSYVYPKRRSMEISNKDGEALVVKIKKFTAEDSVKGMINPDEEL